MPRDIPRYFGTPQQYADLFGFIHANARYLDGHAEAAVAGKGLTETRYDSEPPVTIAGTDEVSAVVRVLPDRADSPAVVHLVDWSEKPASFEVNIDPTCFFGSKPLKYTLLVPAPYDKQAHEQAWKTKDYSRLIQKIILSSGYLTAVKLPPLNPWGILLIEPDSANTTGGLWQPIFEVPAADYGREKLTLKMRPVKPGDTIHYTTDGMPPTKQSPKYSQPIILRTSTVVQARAYRSGTSRSSTIRSAAFRKKSPQVKAIQPDKINNPCLWLKADNLRDKIKDGASVSRWPALKGPAAIVPRAKLYDGNTPQPPAYRQNFAQGKAAIEFDGIDDCLSVPGFANEHLAGSGFTVFMVSHSNDGDFGMCGNHIAGRGGLPRLYLIRGGFMYDRLDGVSPQVDQGATAITTYIHDGRDTITAFGNGKLSGLRKGFKVVDAFGEGGNLAMPLWVANENHPGSMLEIIVYDSPLSDPERQAVETYLAAEYGLGICKIWEYQD
jgi:hypothetical protein